jgi:uncharacterized protein (TIGR02147 family)
VNDEYTQSLSSCSDFRLFLQSELARRCRKNSKYSLRSFAKFLGIESSHLSKMLRKKRPISVRNIERLGVRLGCRPIEIAAFVAQRMDRSESAVSYQYQQISIDQFEIIADPIHYQVLELMKTKNFKTNERWIAQALGTNTHQVRAAVERLKRVGLLHVEGANGARWIDRSEGFSTHVINENFTSQAHKEYQEKILLHAIESLKTVPVEQRDQSSILMATSSQYLQRAKQMITRFRRELCAFLESAPEKDVVFQLGVSLFPVTQTTSSESLKFNSRKRIKCDGVEV